MGILVLIIRVYIGKEVSWGFWWRLVCGDGGKFGILFKES